MIINSNQLVSMTETNQNFSKAAKIVDTKGAALVLKNNKPKYLIIDVNSKELNLSEDAQIDIVAKEILRRYKPAFKNLAK